MTVSKLINDPLLKWRQPTAREKDWIVRMWGINENTYCSPLIGILFLYFGILMIAVCIVFVLQGGDNITGCIVTLAVAVLFLLFASAINNVRKLHERRTVAFAKGDYLVAEAYSTAIYRGKGNDYRTGRTNVSLPSGGCVENLKMPTACTDPLIRKHINQISLLLIQVPDDEVTLTIPVESDFCAVTKVDYGSELA